MSINQVGNSELLRVLAYSKTLTNVTDAFYLRGYQPGDRPTANQLDTFWRELAEKVNHVLQNGVPNWNSSTTYQAGDVVSSGGRVWLCQQTNVNSGPALNNTNWIYFPTTLESAAVGVEGLECSSNVAEPNRTIDITAGRIKANNSNFTLVCPALTKNFNLPYQAGNNNGGMQAGSAMPINGTVHIYAIRNGVNNTVDYQGVPEGTPFVPPANHTFYARVESRPTDAFANFYHHVQHKDVVLLKTPIFVSRTGTSTSAVLHTLPVPKGIKVEAKVAVNIDDAGPSAGLNISYACGGLITSPSINDIGADVNSRKNIDGRREAGVPWFSTGNFQDPIVTNTLGQIRTRFNIAIPNVLVINLFGWRDLQKGVS